MVTGVFARIDTPDTAALTWETNPLMPTTIGRNRRQYVINIRNEYTECRRYNPVTERFDRCDENEAWSVLDAEENKAARLIESDDKTVYTIRFKRAVYELRKPTRPREATDE